jgi:hypothetical protein
MSFRLRTDGNEASTSFRITAGEERHAAFRSRSASVSQKTTSFSPPYNFDGTLSATGATSAMRMKLILWRCRFNR